MCNNSLEFAVIAARNARKRKEKYGSYSSFEAESARLYYVIANKLAIEAVNEAMSLDEGERSKRLASFRESLDGQLRGMSARF